MPVGGRIPSSAPRAAGHPLLATAKMQKKKKKKKWVLVVRRSSLFRPNLPKTQAAIGDHTRKWKIYFFVHFGVFFGLFFVYFSSFFALIRATLGFFVVFPNKSCTLVNKSYAGL